MCWHQYMVTGRNSKFSFSVFHNLSVWTHTQLIHLICDTLHVVGAASKQASNRHHIVSASDDDSWQRRMWRTECVRTSALCIAVPSEFCFQSSLLFHKLFVAILQKSERLLRSCPTYEPLRKGIWPDHTPVARKLYGSLKDLRCTATFIEETGVSI